jgi:hypothetical protein
MRLWIAVQRAANTKHVISGNVLYIARNDKTVLIALLADSHYRLLFSKTCYDSRTAVDCITYVIDKLSVATTPATALYLESDWQIVEAG